MNVSTPKKEGHNFGGKILNWQYCLKCGLITLKNDRTRKAINAACKGQE